MFTLLKHSKISLDSPSICSNFRFPSPEYCTFIFGVLSKLEDKINISNYSVQEARVYGYISELLMDVWLETNAYEYTEVAWGQIGSKHLAKKAISFINRKYGIGKKQTHF